MYRKPGVQEHQLPKTLSFTMAVELPEKGASATFWDLSYSEYRAVPEESEVQASFRDVLRERESHIYSYKKGVLMVHDGLNIHRINSQKDPEERSDRVTLQGHGVLVDGTWRVYF